MNGDEILKLSGRELDVAIAENVFGWTAISYDDGTKYYRINEFIKNMDIHPLPVYHSDIASAYQAVEKVYELTGKWIKLEKESDGMYIAFTESYTDGEVSYDNQSYFRETKEEALCKSCLLAVME